MLAHPMIMQVLPSLESGGVERGTLEINKAITQCGWQSLVASSGGILSSSVGYQGGVHETLPLSSKSPFAIYSNIGRLTRLIRKYGVNLVHARSRAPAWAAYYAAKQTRLPFITSFHGTYGLTGFGKRRYNHIMVRGDRVIAVSNFIRDHILKNYDCNPEKIRVIHRGADLEIFNPERVTPGILAQISQDWWIAENHDPIILMPARLTRWKGHDVLIKALAKLPDKNFLCLMVGDGAEHPDYVRELEQLVVSLGLEGHVRFVGKTKHMTEAYALADVVVAPSIHPEAFGRTVVEAQAMGRVVIASDHGGHAETIIRDKTGFLVPPGDADALAQALRQALSMPLPTRHELGSAAIRHVWDNFSVHEMQRKTIELYAELIAR